MTVRTRFAPSPTGYLHIGGARTALFNYLFARHHGGKFILRIEDTDLERSTEESTQAIFDGMDWLEMDYDEGPFYQSKRSDLYREAALKLLDKGLAYKCFCTAKELTERREAAMKEGRAPRYDRRCRDIKDAGEQEGAPYTVRFRIPEGKTIFKDLIKGPIAIEHVEIEDLVMLRSDGTATYNLTVVVDDATMNITHVIRGDDHINNTPKQILMYEALGYDLPEFAHLPMILGSDKKRLSKRHGAGSVTEYHDLGYLSHALINYLARLGWSHGDDEIFSMEELIEKFSLDSVGKSSGVFNPEKLLWLNHHYIKASTAKELSTDIIERLKKTGVTVEEGSRIEAIIDGEKERSKTLIEMVEAIGFYFKDKVEYEEKPAKKFLKPEKALAPLEALREALADIDDSSFDATQIESAFQGLLDKFELKLGKLAQPVRVALTGTSVSPGIFETIEAMGKDMTIDRLTEAISYMKALPPSAE